MTAWTVRMVCEKPVHSLRYPTYTFTVATSTEKEAVAIAIATCREMGRTPVSYVATLAKPGLVAASTYAMTEVEFRNINPRLTLLLTKELTNA